MEIEQCRITNFFNHFNFASSYLYLWYWDFFLSNCRI